MNPVLTQWFPALVMILAIWFGLLYNNRRLDDFKDLLRSEVRASTSEIKLAINEAEARLTQRIMNIEIRVERLEARVERLESPLVRS